MRVFKCQRCGLEGEPGAILWCSVCRGSYCEGCEPCQGVMFGGTSRRVEQSTQPSLYESDRMSCESCGAVGFHCPGCPLDEPAPAGPIDPRD